ncbi:MAG: universal stress protein [Halobacteriaceae archaeon]
MPIETVVLAVGEDTGERAERLEQVTAEAAGATGARVVVVHVFDEETFAEAASAPHATADPTPAELVLEYGPVQDVMATLDAEGIPYEVRGAVGDPGTEVVRIAREVDAERIVVGGRRRTPAGKATFGSTAQAILLSAPCPVTVSLDGTPPAGGSP